MDSTIQLNQINNNKIVPLSGTGIPVGGNTIAKPEHGLPYEEQMQIDKMMRGGRRRRVNKKKNKKKTKTGKKAKTAKRCKTGKKVMRKTRKTRKTRKVKKTGKKTKIAKRKSYKMKGGMLGPQDLLNFGHNIRYQANRFIDSYMGNHNAVNPSPLEQPINQAPPKIIAPTPINLARSFSKSDI